MSEKKLKPMGDDFQLVADKMMAFRAAGEALDVAKAEAAKLTGPASAAFDQARAELNAAIEAATPTMVAEGLNVFNRGPLMRAIENANGRAGAEAAHFEADRLRRLMGYEKPAEKEERGPGGGGGR